MCCCMRLPVPLSAGSVLVAEFGLETETGTALATDPSNMVASVRVVKERADVKERDSVEERKTAPGHKRCASFDIEQKDGNVRTLTKHMRARTYTHTHTHTHTGWLK